MYSYQMKDKYVRAPKPPFAQWLYATRRNYTGGSYCPEGAARDFAAVDARVPRDCYTIGSARSQHTQRTLSQ